MNGAVIGPHGMEGTEMDEIKTLLGAGRASSTRRRGTALRLGRQVRGAWCLMVVIGCEV